MTEEEYYSVREMAPGVFHIGEPGGVYTTLILGQTRALLVDTGYGYANLYKKVRQLTDLPLEVVLTHGHADHFGGAWAFDEVWFNMTDYASYRWYQDEQKVLIMEKFARDRAAAGLPDVWPDDFDKEGYKQLDIQRMLPYEAGKVFDLGGRRVRAIGLPGHTAGSMMFLDDVTGLMISGDSISDSLWMFFDASASVTEYERALAHLGDQLEGIAVTGVLAAHRDFILPPEIIEEMLYTVRQINPASDKRFIHPRTQLRGLCHREKCRCSDRFRYIYVVYRPDRL